MPWPRSLQKAHQRAAEITMWARRAGPSSSGEIPQREDVGHLLPLGVGDGAVAELRAVFPEVGRVVTHPGLAEQVLVQDVLAVFEELGAKREDLAVAADTAVRVVRQAVVRRHQVHDVVAVKHPHELAPRDEKLPPGPLRILLCGPAVRLWIETDARRAESLVRTCLDRTQPVALRLIMHLMDEELREEIFEFPFVARLRFAERLPVQPHGHLRDASTTCDSIS
jgi:hypothetical protein